MLDHQARGALDVARVRRALVAVLIVAGPLARASRSAPRRSSAASSASEQDELARRIAERRAAIRAGREGGAQASTPLRALERRKYQSPSSVIVLEVLSQILPDHTYVTELRIEGDKLRVIGVTRDAPGLIRLIEQSPHFTRATFFAPTTTRAVRSGRALPHRGADRARVRVALMTHRLDHAPSDAAPLLARRSAMRPPSSVLLALAW